MSVTAERRTEQRGQALERANEVRLGMAALRAEMAAGEVTFVEALDDPRSASCGVGLLLTYQRRWGTGRMRTLLRHLAITETRKVRDLTERQRTVLREAVEQGTSRRALQDFRREHTDV